MDITTRSKNYKSKEPIITKSHLPGERFSQLGTKLIDRIDALFVWSIVILFLVILFCLGLWGYRMSLEKRLDDLAQNKEELQSERDLDLERDFADLKKRIDTLKIILDRRIYPSKAFKMIEELVLGKVRIDKFNIDLEERKMVWNVEAEDYSALAKQLYVLENDFRIERASLNKVSLNNMGHVVSDIEMEINDDFLRSEE